MRTRLIVTLYVVCLSCCVCGIILDKYIYIYIYIYTHTHTHTQIISELSHDATCTPVKGWLIVWAVFLKDKNFCMSCI